MALEVYFALNSMRIMHSLNVIEAAMCPSRVGEIGVCLWLSMLPACAFHHSRATILL